MLAAINDPVRVPPEIEHVMDPTGLPESEQLESLEEKPDPDTETVDANLRGSGIDSDRWRSSGQLEGGCRIVTARTTRGCDKVGTSSARGNYESCR